MESYSNSGKKRRRLSIEDQRSVAGKKGHDWRVMIGNRPKGKVPLGDVYFYIPATYDHTKLLPDHPRRVDDAHYVLSRIVDGHNARHHDAHRFVNLNAELLRKYIHPRYQKPVMQWLIDAGVLECDGVSKRRSKSLGYRLTKAYEGKLRRVKCTSITMGNKIVNWRHERDKKILASGLPDAQLFACLLRLEIDLPGAVRTIKNDTDIEERRSQAIATCETIANREFEYIICPHRRRHTNVTRLPTVARAFLSIDGEPLVEAADIRNSQVVFVAIMLQKARGSSLRPDERKFVDLTMEGRIYDFLMTKGNWNEGRKKFKRSFFGYVLYANHTKAFNTKHPVLRLFAKWFPNVFKFILEQKKLSFKDLARNMQRQEAEFMIETVCLRLLRDHDIPLITIHDSILTHRRHVGLVRRVIMEEFARLGIRPTLSPLE